MSATSTRTPRQRMTVRAIVADDKGSIKQILEQEIPATDHAVSLLLRRAPFREAVAYAMARGWTTKFELARKS